MLNSNCLMNKRFKEINIILLIETSKSYLLVPFQAIKYSFINLSIRYCTYIEKI